MYFFVSITSWFIESKFNKSPISCLCAQTWAIKLILVLNLNLNLNLIVVKGFLFSQSLFKFINFVQIPSETQSWRTVVRTNSGRLDSHRKRKHPVFFSKEAEEEERGGGGSCCFSETSAVFSSSRSSPPGVRDKMEYKLIMAVSGFPSLYDSNSVTYRDLNMRSEAWRQVALIVGVPGGCPLLVPITPVLTVSRLNGRRWAF